MAAGVGISQNMERSAALHLFGRLCCDHLPVDMLQYWISLSDAVEVDTKCCLSVTVCTPTAALLCYQTSYSTDCVVLSTQDGDSLTFRAPQQLCGDRLTAEIEMDAFLLCLNFVVFIHNLSSRPKCLHLFNFLFAPPSAQVFNLPLAHVLICRVNGHGPGVGVRFFYGAAGSVGCMACWHPAQPSYSRLHQ